MPCKRLFQLRRHKGDIYRRYSSHVVVMDKGEGFKFILELIDHATQLEYVFHVSRENPGDLEIWDIRGDMRGVTSLKDKLNILQIRIV